MKKYIFLFAVIILLFTALPAKAGTYRDPYTLKWGYKAGDCTMVDTRSEADATHVYTLNPDNTVQLNSSYVGYWNRNARCDELQFHIDHNTSLTKLRSWLGGIATGWFKKIGATHFRHQTVSTLRNEWFYIDEQGAHRISDWLTGLSWGLLIDDRISIALPLTDAFYNNVTISTPLKFNDGRYKTKIYNIWKNGSRNYSGLPSRLKTEIKNMINRDELYGSIFEKCSFFSDHGDPRTDLLDWSWMLSNPSCS